MPTNEEKQEIAENLRIMAIRGRCKYAEQFYELLKETVMDSWDFHEFGDVADRLADLIEPEPEIITCEFDSQACGKRRCKRCGAFVSVDSVWDCFSCIPVRYCPNCGAKVISNAD